MVKVKFSGLITGMRGKINGSIFTANRYGDVLRNKAVPVNRQSQPHSVERASLANRSQEWREMTQGQRDAWIAATPDFSRIDVFGDPYDLSGINLYVSINRNRISVGVAVTAIAPAPQAVISLNTLTLSASTGPEVLSATFTDTPTHGTTVFILFATKQLLPGIQHFEKHYRKITTIPAGTGSPHDIIDSYQGVFPASFIVGQKIAIKFVPINNLSYQSGVIFEASTIIT